MTTLNPNDPVTALRSVGEARAALFHRLGLYTVRDVLEHYPRDYMDRSRLSQIADLVPGAVSAVLGVAASDPKVFFTNRRSVVKVKIQDGSGCMEAVWFNQPYIKNVFQKNQTYLLTGQVKEKFQPFDSDGSSPSLLEMQAPDYDIVNGQELLSGGRIVPLYASTGQLSQKMLRKVIFTALQAADAFPDLLPPSLRERFALCPKDQAVRNIHFPESAEKFLLARRRLVFEELLFMALALKRAKSAVKQHSALCFSRFDLDPVLSAFPFALTCGQREALDDILTDLRGGQVMNRLIQGDVGSGKTAVAMTAAYIAIANGTQAAVMAPTEVLARQHLASFQTILQPLGIETAFLTGSLSAAEKRQAHDRIRSGEARMIIGTHALIQKKVEYAGLGLIITDEQHRFGVDQRFSLARKGHAPHVLVMTATPIPRTLALVLYGDLDVSVIRDLPPGRQPVQTYFVSSAYRARIHTFIRKALEEGRQAFVVCPVIEASENNDGALRDVKQYAAELSRVLAGFQVRCLHGKQAFLEKQDIMQAFADNRIHVLVSTTVIEVGIHVPNATIMLIENADRFGLAQLHQLRGRVGRGAEASCCILVSDTKSGVSREKLQAMTQTSDGFALSELDLKARGPGDFFGVRQHGLPDFKIANLYQDMEILREAWDAAQAWDVPRAWDAPQAFPESADASAEIDRIFRGFRGEKNGEKNIVL
ncbi:MAG: ATP-dependent DNA helicase RecG [Clostridiales bacterium]|jgi:ATP-dependent DNA helicase RecG|nr:ATP-dependent DNA helicase RecG [Clostridiales bacterium]